MNTFLKWLFTAVFSALAYVLSTYVFEYFRPYQYQKIRIYNRNR